MKRTLLLIVTALLLFGCNKAAHYPTLKRYHKKHLFIDGLSKDGRAPSDFETSGKRGMVVSESHYASEVGKEILAKGGNAVDAAIATSFMLAVTRPHATGIGGGGFMLIYDSNEKDYFFLDMRERAPKSLKSDSLIGVNKESNLPLSRFGGLAVGTPGLVAGLYEAYERFSTKKLSWSELVTPAAERAEEGFPIYPHLARAIEWLEEQGALELDPNLTKLITHEDGSRRVAGDTYRNSALSKTLRTIAEKGPDEFYQGNIAKEMSAATTKFGGALAVSDLNTYEVISREPIRGKYRNTTIVSAPPPSSGGTHIVQMANMLEAYDLGKLQFSDSKTLHLKAAVMRRAFADRAYYLGDPDFVEVPTDWLTSKSYGESLSSEISLESKQEFVTHGKTPKAESMSTTHFSLVDGKNNVVSLTQSINFYFGAGIVAGDTGIILNNTMDDFAVLPGKPNIFGLVGSNANLIEGGKTPLSSMSPTIVSKNGEPFLILGSPGGPKIINAVMNVILNVVDHKMSLRDAVFAPRVHHQWAPDEIVVDKDGFPDLTLGELGIMGYSTEETASGVGCISAIVKTKRGWRGVGDPRREGSAVGY